MDRTPSKSSRTDTVRFSIAADMPSSPRRSPRIKKPPPITPRRFTRFFTPKLKKGSQAVKTSRKALKNLSGIALNSRQNESDASRPFKRRKLSFQSPSSLPSSPIRHVGFLSSSQDHPTDDEDDTFDEDIEEILDSEATTDVEEHAPKVARYNALGLSSQLVNLRLSAGQAIQRQLGGELWQDETAHFYSSPEDLNADNGPPPPGDWMQAHDLFIPFCAASCKTNSLVAVGDEDGRIRLIETANDYSNEFKRSHLVLKPHDNAVMDLEFSEDDYLLATASGDQSCQIIDVQQQRSLYALCGHTSSVKKIQFQPGNSHTFATCSRDGTVSIWDIRVKLSEQPLCPTGPSLTAHTIGREPIKCIHDAHTSRQRPKTSAQSGRSDFSVTALTFLDSTRPHLLATTSETDSIVKLWDIRAKHTYRNKPVPVSCTREPKSHELHRRFGITSMAMSTDSSKLYTLCRDHTIYAFSTSHLILGSGPEMSSEPPLFQPRNGSGTGLGPLYGFRHPSLQISTFYPKLTVRKATDTNTELIAVGSSDDCAVIFPTSERYLTKSAQVIPPHPSLSNARPRLTRIDSQSTSLAFLRRRHNDDVPVYYHGTPLIKGHNKEVTGVAWSNEGNLVTISDDHTTRCWRWDENKARGLRKGYDGEVERYGSGWAAVRDGYDDEN